MRDIEEQRLALECLRLAQGDIVVATDMLAFVTGGGQDAGPLTINIAAVPAKFAEELGEAVSLRGGAGS